MRRCGVPPPPPPPPIIFERLKLPQQIIYRRKENLSENPNHFKYIIYHFEAGALEMPNI